MSNYFNHLNSPVGNLEIIVQDCLYCKHALPMKILEMITVLPCLGFTTRNPSILFSIGCLYVWALNKIQSKSITKNMTPNFSALFKPKSLKHNFFCYKNKNFGLKLKKTTVIFKLVQFLRCWSNRRHLFASENQSKCTSRYSRHIDALEFFM